MSEKRYDFVNDHELPEEISRHKFLVVVFGASWCNCTISLLNSIFYDFITVFPELMFRYIIIETNRVEPEDSKEGKYANPKSKADYKISRYPTVVTFFQGKEVDRGVLKENHKEDLKKMIEKLLKHSQAG